MTNQSARVTNFPPSTHQLALVWEVYARIGLAPEQVVHLLGHQGIIVTAAQAKAQLYQARRRNSLRLVSHKVDSQ